MSDNISTGEQHQAPSSPSPERRFTVTKEDTFTKDDTFTKEDEQRAPMHGTTSGEAAREANTHMRKHQPFINSKNKYFQKRPTQAASSQNDNLKQQMTGLFLDMEQYFASEKPDDWAEAELIATQLLLWAELPVYYRARAHIVLGCGNGDSLFNAEKAVEFAEYGMSRLDGDEPVKAEVDLLKTATALLEKVRELARRASEQAKPKEEEGDEEEEEGADKEEEGADEEEEEGADEEEEGADEEEGGADEEEGGADDQASKQGREVVKTAASSRPRRSG